VLACRCPYSDVDAAGVVDVAVVVVSAAG